MDKQTINAKVKEIVAAPSCCAELKAAGQAWLDSVGSPAQKEAAEKLVRELKEDICGIDDVLALFSSDAGAKLFGAETAAQLASKAKEVKASGGKYCFCPACQAGVEVLAHREALFA